MKKSDVDKKPIEAPRESFVILAQDVKVGDIVMIQGRPCRIAHRAASK